MPSDPIGVARSTIPVNQNAIYDADGKQFNLNVWNTYDGWGFDIFERQDGLNPWRAEGNAPTREEAKRRAVLALQTFVGVKIGDICWEPPDSNEDASHLR